MSGKGIRKHITDSDENTEAFFRTAYYRATFILCTAFTCFHVTFLFMKRHFTQNWIKTTFALPVGKTLACQTAKE